MAKERKRGVKTKKILDPPYDVGGSAHECADIIELSCSLGESEHETEILNIMHW